MPSEPRTEPTLEELSAYVDAELDPGEQARVAAHVGTCPDCRACLEGLQKAAHAIRGLPMETPRRRFTVPARRPSRRPWMVAFGWVGSAAVAVLLIGVGITHLPSAGSNSTAGTASFSQNTGANYATGQGAASPGAELQAGAVSRADKALGANRVTVIDPRNSSRRITVSTDSAVYPAMGTMLVSGYTTGDRTGKITIVLRRGSYAVSLATPATTQSTPGLAFSGSYALSRLPLIDPRTGSYTLVVTWTDSAGVSLIAELPVAITS